MSGECNICGQHGCVEATHITPGPCAACGREPALGFAPVGDLWYGHDEQQDCYEQVLQREGLDEVIRLSQQLDLYNTTDGVIVRREEP